MQTLNTSDERKSCAALLQAVLDRSTKVAVIGLGYVGLPLATAIARADFVTVGFDIDPEKVRLINAGKSYIDAVTDYDLSELIEKGRLSASKDFVGLSSADVIIICVPTPLTRHREPDLSFVEKTALTIGKYLRCGQIVVLESTSFPGTTMDFLKPILEGGGLKSGKDFFLGFLAGAGRPRQHLPSNDINPKGRIRRRPRGETARRKLL
jgi:UDP-N-acetyl-D-glucosamine dehydrogenase